MRDQRDFGVALLAVGAAVAAPESHLLAADHALEVLDAVREAAGPKRIVGVSASAMRSTARPATFDKAAPTFADFSRFHDIPLIGSGGAEAPYDPFWTGTVDGPFNAITLDFWAKTPVGDLLGEVNYAPSIWAGGTQFELPTITQSIDPQVGDLAHGRAGAIAFGIDDPRHARPSLQHAADSRYCIRCGRPTRFNSRPHSLPRIAGHRPSRL